jgi:hypothetical protein
MSSLDKFERFEAWLKENGAQFDMVPELCRFWAFFVTKTHPIPLLSFYSLNYVNMIVSVL